RRLAAVDLLVGVAIGEARHAGAAADAARAAPRDQVLSRADGGAAAAMVGIPIEIHFAAIGHVAVAVGEARRAGDPAGAIDARGRAVRARALVAAGAAIGGIA